LRQQYSRKHPHHIWQYLCEPFRIKRLNKEEVEKNINLAIVSANNHYAGFGPGTANIFRKMVQLPEVIWEKEETEEEDNESISKQSSISDFMI